MEKVITVPFPRGRMFQLKEKIVAMSLLGMILFLWLKTISVIARDKSLSKGKKIITLLLPKMRVFHYNLTTLDEHDESMSTESCRLII